MVGTPERHALLLAWRRELAYGWAEEVPWWGFSSQYLVRTVFHFLVDSVASVLYFVQRLELAGCLRVGEIDLVYGSGAVLGTHLSNATGHRDQLSGIRSTHSWASV